MDLSHTQLPSNTKPLYKSKRNTIAITFLDQDFYEDIKADTSKKLDKFSKKAKLIPTSSLYGQFINDAHYMETLDLVLNSTAETCHRGVFYLKQILPQLNKKQNLLDIGPGNGQLTQLISKPFKEITLVDTCDIALDKNEELLRYTRKDLSLTKIHSSILEVELPTNHYDLVMLSHVLYYIEVTEWMKATKICYHALRSGGIMVIVLSGAKLGKASLMRKFSGKVIDIDSYIKDCTDFFPHPVEVFISKENFYARDLNTMLQIAGFLLYDGHTCATKEELADYLLMHHKKNKNLFEISTQQEFIVIKKP